MKHTFLLEEGLWTARGERWDASGLCLEAEGRVQVVHRGVRWSLEEELRLADAARTVLKSRAEAVAFPVEHGCTEWTAQDPAMGPVSGLFAIAGDAILSSFGSADRRHTGSEVLLQLRPEHYLRRGFIARDGLRIAAWSLELARVK